MLNKKTIKGWTQRQSPKELKVGDGWFAELDRVYRKNDGRFVCMMRDLKTEWGKITHCTITSLIKPTWMEKQNIKNELFGKESLAIEVFPKESKLVDDADMYHLWILHDQELPFGLK